MDTLGQGRQHTLTSCCPPVWGPILFSLYTNPISSIIHSHSSIIYHFYPNDTQLYIALSPANFSHSLQKLKNCLNDIQNSMFTNKLKLNPDKTEFILIGSKTTVNNSFLTFQSILLGIRSHQHKVSRTSEWCLIPISPSLTMCHRSSSPLEFMRETSYRIRPLLDLKTISFSSKCFGEQQIGLLQFPVLITH